MINWYLKILLSISMLYFSCQNPHTEEAHSSQKINSTEEPIKISAEYIYGCETGEGDCTPILVKRKAQRSPKVIFPIGGSITDIAIYEKTEEVNLNNILEETPIFEKKAFYDDGSIELNTSNLKDGQYIIHMTSCSFGGIFELRLKTI